MLKYEKCDIEKAIKGSGGIMTTIATRLGCSWHTAKKKIAEFDLQELYDDETETVGDMVEGMLYKNIKSGDVASILFYLKTKGKNRGYSERNQLDHLNNGGTFDSPTVVFKKYDGD